MDPFTYYFQSDANDDRFVTLKIVSRKQIDDNIVEYMGAHPPDRRTSFSGSALPFPNEEHAYDNTPTKGRIVLDESKPPTGELTFALPNAYYTNLGNDYIKPHLRLRWKEDGRSRETRIDLLDKVPFRTLTHPLERTSPHFYEHDDLVSSQESILRKNGYPQQLQFMSS